MDCSMPCLLVHHQLLEFTQTHVHWVGDAIQPLHPQSPLLSPSILPSIRVFSNEWVLCIMWPKYWSFSFSISSSNEYLGLISLRMDWLDLLAVQGTLKSLLQHHSLRAQVIQCSGFFIVQLSHPYMTIGKTMALTRWTFLAKLCLSFLIFYVHTYEQFSLCNQMYIKTLIFLIEPVFNHFSFITLLSIILISLYILFLQSSIFTLDLLLLLFTKTIANSSSIIWDL